MINHSRRFLSTLTAVLALAVTAPSSAADPPDTTHAGRASVYANLSNSSLEAVSLHDQMLGYVMSPNSVAPTAIWTMLEHGERVECLACIPYVSKMLYASNAKTREISAWWLRRRIFGVFGPGEVYEQLVKTVGDPAQPELSRAHAASALGEFLEGTGIEPVGRALSSDKSPIVRLAAANALIRLNHEGQNFELAGALLDEDESVRLAALNGVTHINVFSKVERVARLIGDASPAVRRRAAQALGTLKSADAVVDLIAITSPSNEDDPGVRAAAVWALGQIADPEARDAVLSAKDDADSAVRDAAKVALFRL